MPAATTWRILQPDGTVNHIPGEAVGTFYVGFKVANGDDLALVRRGLLPPDEIRTATLQGLVDTGATRLVLPSWVAEQLAFPEQGTTLVRYADQRRAEKRVVSQVQLYLLGRTGSFSAVIEPDRKDALIGAFVLEELDLLVDPRMGRLIPRDPNTTLTEIE
jgi:predicted aspartyl protease